jgi:predicted metalloprotease
MKWQGRRESRNIEDRRSGGGRRAAGGIGGIAGVLILLAGIYFGFDTSGFVDLGGGGATQASSEITQANKCAAQFVS